MDTNSTTEVLPSPPSLMNALMAGFDTVTAHITLILFPIALDLLLWLGPRLKIGVVVDPYLKQLVAYSGLENPAQATGGAQIVEQASKFVAERLNLFALLRTYPVGIPSLMWWRLPAETPGPAPLSWNALGGVMFPVVILVLITFGLILGAFYFISVSQMTLSREASWRNIFQALPNASRQVIVLSLFWLLLFLAVTVPASCIIVPLMSGNDLIGRLGVFMYAALLLWLAFPLILSPYGIFVHKDTALASIRRGVRITRMTLPTTSMLFLVILVISEGMDILWNSTPDKSWMSAIGIAGHAFITTALLAASFIYYKEADQWVQITLARLKLNSPRFKV